LAMWSKNYIGISYQLNMKKSEPRERNRGTFTYLFRW